MLHRIGWAVFLIALGVVGGLWWFIGVVLKPLNDWFKSKEK